MKTSKKTQAMQVYYPIADYFLIKQVAKSKKMPVAKWIREITLKEANKKSKKPITLYDALPKIKLSGEDTHTSERIDEIIYNNPHGE
jgi:hypothetical protein